VFQPRPSVDICEIAWDARPLGLDIGRAATIVDLETLDSKGPSRAAEARRAATPPDEGAFPLLSGALAEDEGAAAVSTGDCVFTHERQSPDSVEEGSAVAVAGCGSRLLATGLREATGLASAQVAGSGVGGVISLASLRRF
jgi:hypothetical protein